MRPISARSSSSQPNQPSSSSSDAQLDQPVDYLVVGQVCLDESETGETLGGTVTYAADAARAFGLRPGAVTTAPDDARLKRELRGIPLVVQTSPSWTRFRNVYHGGRRRQLSTARAGEMDPAVIPLQWLDEAKIIHFAPIAGEIRPVPGLRRPARIVGLTVQGLMRQFLPDGGVVVGNPALTESELSMVDVVVASHEDVVSVPTLPGRWARTAGVVVVTLGEDGADVYEAGAGPERVATQRVVASDPTGAGDVFAAALFIALQRGETAKSAAGFANRFVAAALEAGGGRIERAALREAASHESNVTSRTSRVERHESKVT